MSHKKVVVFMCAICFILSYKVQTQTEKKCIYYKNFNYNFNFCKPVNWEEEKESSFLYTPGKFIAGWIKRDVKGNAIMSVFIQKPGSPVNFKKMIEASAEIIKELYSPDNINYFIDKEILQNKEVAWISAHGGGTGEQFGNGNIPTSSIWAITNIKDNNLLLFFFSSPLSLYDKLISEFKQVISSLHISEEEKIETRKESKKVIELKTEEKTEEKIEEIEMLRGKTTFATIITSIKENIIEFDCQAKISELIEKDDILNIKRGGMSIGKIKIIRLWKNKAEGEIIEKSKGIEVTKNDMITNY